MGPLSERARVRAALLAVCALGAGLRVAASIWERPLHPDEFFQYLEPAWWHLTGGGVETWEWQDGVRSWVLPFYNGAWMALLMLLGVERGAHIAWLLQLHWALVNTSLIYLAFRGGCVLTRQLAPAAPAPRADAAPAGFEGGLIAAGLCALFPLLVLYSVHTLSELPSMLCLLAGLVVTAEVLARDAQAPEPAARRQIVLAGALLSLGACLRIANGPLALVPPLWLCVRRKYRLLVLLCAAALLPVLLFALVDLFTWGRFAGSFIGYIKFNLIEGQAARFGTAPPGWYLERLWGSAQVGLPLLLVLALASARVSWPYLLSALGLIAYLSTQAHKEGRFMIGFWPLISIAAAGTLGAWIARARAAEPGEPPTRHPLVALFARPGARVAAALLLVVLVPIDAARDAWQDHWIDPDRVACQRWAGAQHDLTGLLIDDAIFGSGSMWIDNRAPELSFSRGLLTNPLLNYVVVGERSRARRDAQRGGFEVVFRRADFVVLRRRAAP